MRCVFEAEWGRGLLRSARRWSLRFLFDILEFLKGFLWYELRLGEVSYKCGFQIRGELYSRVRV